jgi:hypothetical protein
MIGKGARGPTGPLPTSPPPPLPHHRGAHPVVRSGAHPVVRVRPGRRSSSATTRTMRRGRQSIGTGTRGGGGARKAPNLVLQPIVRPHLTMRPQLDDVGHHARPRRLWRHLLRQLCLKSSAVCGVKGPGGAESSRTMSVHRAIEPRVVICLMPRTEIHLVHVGRHSRGQGGLVVQKTDIPFERIYVITGVFDRAVWFSCSLKKSCLR